MEEYHLGSQFLRLLLDYQALPKELGAITTGSHRSFHREEATAAAAVAATASIAGASRACEQSNPTSRGYGYSIW